MLKYLKLVDKTVDNITEKMVAIFFGILGLVGIPVLFIYIILKILF